MDADLLLGAQATGGQFSVVIDGVTYRVVQVDSQGRLVVTGAGAPTPIMITPASPNCLGVQLAAHGSNIGAPTGAVWPAANLALFIPFVLAESVTVLKLFCANGTIISGNVDLAIYNAAGTRLVSSGSTANAGASSIQEFNIVDTVMGPGQFYLAMAVNNVTATFLRWSGGFLVVVKSLGLAQQTAAFPLPATATLAASSSIYIPVFGLSLRTLVA